MHPLSCVLSILKIWIFKFKPILLFCFKLTQRFPLTSDTPKVTKISQLNTKNWWHLKNAPKPLKKKALGIQISLYQIV
jgi:hypothetical protein